MAPPVPNPWDDLHNKLNTNYMLQQGDLNVIDQTTRERLANMQRQAQAADAARMAQEVRAGRQRVDNYRDLVGGGLTDLRKQGADQYGRELQVAQGLGAQNLREGNAAGLQFHREVQAANAQSWMQNAIAANQAHANTSRDLLLQLAAQRGDINSQRAAAMLDAAGGGGGGGGGFGGGGGGYGGFGSGGGGDVLPSGVAGDAATLATEIENKGEYGRAALANTSPALRQFLTRQHPIGPRLMGGRVLDGGWTTRQGAERAQAVAQWHENRGRGVKNKVSLKAVKKFFKRKDVKDTDWRTRGRRKNVKKLKRKLRGQGY